MHWLGVYYMEGFGVSQNLDLSEKLLLKASKEGNGQSSYQLFIMYSTIPTKKNTIKAYKFLNKSINLGVTHFEEQDKFFKANYDVLKPIFVEIRKPPAELTSQK